MLKQGERSVSNRVNGNCKYRTVKDGKNLMCGVGVFISDNEYNPNMEGETASDMLRKFAPNVYSTINAKKLYILDGIQHTHDAKQPEQWADEFKQLRARIKTL